MPFTCKGYALIEYENFEEAQAAVAQMNGTELLTQTINVDWAFSSGPINKRRNMNRRLAFMYTSLSSLIFVILEKLHHAVCPTICED